MTLLPCNNSHGAQEFVEVKLLNEYNHQFPAKDLKVLLNMSKDESREGRPTLCSCSLHTLRGTTSSSRSRDQQNPRFCCRNSCK
jgi:hypothetical protein